jgi:hypothetical protein
MCVEPVITDLSPLYIWQVVSVLANMVAVYVCRSSNDWLISRWTTQIQPVKYTREINQWLQVLHTSTAIMLANTVTTCQIYKGDKSVITGSTHIYSYHVGQQLQPVKYTREINQWLQVLHTSMATMLANTVTTCQIYKGDKSVITGSAHIT